MAVHRPFFKKLVKAATAVSLALALVCGLLLIFGAALSPATAAPLDTAVSGIITSDTTWTPAGNPYTVTGVVQVQAVLTIEPGVVVSFADGAQLSIETSGQLNAVGLATQPIQFTAANPAQCAWEGLDFKSGGNILQYALLEYAKQAVKIEFSSNSNIIEYNTFQYNGGCSADPTSGAIIGATDDTDIRHNVFTSNHTAIYLSRSSINRIENNIISGTVQNGIFFGPTPGTPSQDNQILSNTIRHTGGYGIYFSTGNINWIQYNQVYSNTTGGVRLENQTLLGYTRYNDIYDNTGPGLYLSAITTTSSGIEPSLYVVENLLVNNQGGGILWGGNSSSGGTYRFLSNVICQNSQYSFRNTDTFTVPVTPDWWGTNSPTVGSGTEIQGMVNIDPRLIFTATPVITTLPADGLSTTAITVSIQGGGATVPARARTVNLTTNLGMLSPAQVTLNANGIATTTLQSAPVEGTATITATEFCGYPITTTVQFQTTDLEINKSTAITQIIPGQAITYTIAYTNNAGVAATNAVITDTLPANVQWLTDTAESLGFSRDQTSPEVVWSHPSLPDGTTGTITLVGRLPDTAVAACGTTLTNSVVITTATVESDTTNNRSSAGGVSVICADVGISKDSTLSQAVPGETITYTLSFSNSGAAPAQNIILTDTLPANVTWLTDTAESVGLNRTQTAPVVWDVGELASGANASFTLVGQLQADATCGVSLANTAEIATPSPDQTPGNESATHSGISTICADVAVSKSTALTQVVPGETVTYTVAYSNNGSAPAQNIIITDTLPANVTWLTDTAESDGFSRQQTSTEVGWLLATLTAGGSGTITLVGQAQPALGCGATLTNQIAITSTSPEANPANQTGSNSDISTICADVTLTKIGPAGPVLAGSTLTYTLHYTNNGSAPAQNVVITDINPITGGVDTLLNGITLDPNAGGSIDYPVVVDPAICGLNATVNITNTGFINTATPESDAGNNDSAFANTVNCLPDLVITKTRISSAASLGRPITFTIEYHNRGVVTAPTVILTDTLPAGVAYVTDTTGLSPITTTGTVAWNLGDVGPGQSGAFDVVLAADTLACTGSSVTYINQVEIDSALPDVDPADNIDAASSGIIPCNNVDMVVLKNDGVGGPTERLFVWAGDLITYTLTYLNVGGEDATGVVITETLPAHTSFVGPAGWTQVGATAQYTYDLGTVPSMNGDRLYFVVQVDPGLPVDVDEVLNEVRIDSAEPDAVPADNVSYEQTPVQATADLAVAKASLTPVTHPGDPVSYAITVTNQGSVTATNVTITDTLPTGTTYVTNTILGAPVSSTTTTVAWNLAQLDPGQTVRFDLTLLVDNDTGLCSQAFLVNTVEAQSDTPEGDYSNNIAATTAGSSPVIACRDVAITKTPDDPNTSLDRDVIFTLEYGNPGLITATNVVITDTLPAGLTLIGSNPPYNSGGSGTYQWNLPDLSPGISGTVVITAHTAGAGLCGQTLTNTAAITANFTGGSDEYTGNNLTNATIDVRCVPDLVIVKNDRIGAPWEPPFVQPGDVFTYSILYSNIGIGPANNVVISETLPANTLFRGPSGWTLAGSDVYTYFIGTVPSGAGFQVEFAVEVTGYPAGGFITNTVCIGTDNDEVTLNNNCSSDQTLVTQNQPRLEVSKSAIPAGGSTVFPGDTLTYTVVVRSNGTQTANNILITDTLPLTDVTFVSATLSSGDPLYGPNPLTASVFALPVNDAVTMTVEVVINNVVSGTIISNLAEAVADLLPVQQSLPVTHVVAARPVITTNLAITKTAQMAAVTVGDPIVYDVTVTNLSSMTATNVTITDTMPSGSGYLSDTTGLTHTLDLNTVAWHIGQLDPGQTYTFSLTLSTNPAACVFRPLTNTITVGSAESDTDPANNTDTAPTGIFCQDINISKSVDLPQTTPDQDVVFTLTYENPGILTATNVVVSDTLPLGISFVSSTPPAFGPVNRSYSWNLGDVSPGITGTITLVGHVEPGVTCDSVLTNTAQITTTSTDENPLNNTATASVEALCGIDMSLVKNDGVGGPAEPPFVQVDDVITYSLSYNNLGTGPGTRVVLTETLPNHTSFVGPSGADGWFPVGGGQYTYTLNSVNAGSGGVVDFAVQVTALPSGGFITNTACIGSLEVDVLPGNNCSFEQTPVTSNAPRLQVNKTAVPTGGSAVQPGDTITYTVIVLNDGQASVGNVRITDTLPLTEVTFITANLSSGDPLFGPNPLTATITTLPINSPLTMTVVVSVNNVLAGTVFTNTAQAVADSLPVQTSLPVTHVVTSTVPVTSDLAIVKSATPPGGSTVEPNDVITYSVVVSNNGTTAMSNVIVTDTLPLANVSFITAALSSGGPVYGPNPLTATAAGLPAGNALTMTVVVSVNNVATGTIISNQAQAAADTIAVQTSLPVTHVISSSLALNPNFALTKSADPPGGTPVTYGDTITYTIVAANNGGPATGVALTDTIPTGTAYVPGSAATNLGGVVFTNSQVVVNAPNVPANFTLTTTFRVSVTTNFTTTISNQARLSSDQTPLTTSNVVTHPVLGSQAQNVYLPIILKNYAGPSAALSWVDQSQDRVREVDGINSQAFTPDGRSDGAFQLTVNVGSQGPKAVDNVRLLSSQGASVQWDTIVNGVPVLGIFDGSTRLNNADGTLNQTINGQTIVTLYASDDAGSSRFPPDTYDYTVIVTFTDGTSVSATARIPAPPPPVCYIDVVADIAVGSDPRGVVVDEARSRAYVANFGSDSVSVVDTGSNTVIQTISGITTANGIALDPGRNLVWVTNYDSGQVTPIEAGTGTALAPVSVGSGPWGVAFDPVHDYIYVVNNQDDSVTMIDADSRAVVSTLTGSFDRPYHIAANPVTGKVYAPNFGNHTVTIINGTAVSSMVNLNVDDPSTQPYGVAVDEVRDVVYVSTVDSHRVVAIGTLAGMPDRLLGWAAFHRGYFNPVPHRPVPMRAIAVNPTIGSIPPDMDDGGHVWTTTSTGDGSEANQTLFIPKGWVSYFHSPLPCEVGINPTEGIAIHRGLDRAYVTSGGASGTLRVFSDNPSPPLVPFSASEQNDYGISFELFKVE